MSELTTARTGALQRATPPALSMSMEDRARAAHAWYCNLHELTYDMRWVEREWFAALDAFDARDIARAARYVRKQILTSGWDRNAALPRNFLQPDRLAEYVAISTPKRQSTTAEDAELVRTFAELIGETLQNATNNEGPEGWKQWIKAKYPDARITTWKALPADVREEVKREMRNITMSCTAQKEDV